MGVVYVLDQRMVWSEVAWGVARMEACRCRVGVDTGFSELQERFERNK